MLSRVALVCLMGSLLLLGASAQEGDEDGGYAPGDHFLHDKSSPDYKDRWEMLFERQVPELEGRKRRQEVPTAPHSLSWIEQIQQAFSSADLVSPKVLLPNPLAEEIEREIELAGS